MTGLELMDLIELMAANKMSGKSVTVFVEFPSRRCHFDWTTGLFMDRNDKVVDIGPDAAVNVTIT